MSLTTSEACRAELGAVRAAWGWLGEQRVPGPTDPPSERHITAEQAAAEDREVRRDRLARHLPQPARGNRDTPSGVTRYLHVPPGSATGPHADAARIAPIHGRIIVAAMLRRTAEMVHLAVEGHALTWVLHDPRQRTGATCHLCGTAAVCGCDIDDVQAQAAMHVISARLGAGLDEDTLAGLLRDLQRANREARRAAGAADIALVLKAPCPACDSRDLVADCTSPNRDEWSIRCRNTLCRCAGQGCACGRIVRVPGKGHLWPAARGQWHDLARKLGVPLHGLLADAMRRPAPPSTTSTGA